MMTVAITGVTGLLGGNVAETFLSAGWRVRALGRPSSDTTHLTHLPLEWRVVSFENPDELSSALTGAEVVIHCAGVTSQSPRLSKSLNEGNIELTSRILEACSVARVERLIHCSSTVTCGFSTSPHPPVTEDRAERKTPPWPDGYFESKRAAEELAMRYKDRGDVVVVNPGYLIGPLDSKPSSGRLVLHAARGRAPGWTEGSNNFVDVRDVGIGILGAVQSGRSGERYILGGHNLSYREFLTKVAAISGRSPPSFQLPQSLANAAGMMGDLLERVTGKALDVNSATVGYAGWTGLRYSSEKAMRELGYRIRPIDNAIHDAISWFSGRGLIDQPTSIRPNSS